MASTATLHGAPCCSARPVGRRHIAAPSIQHNGPRLAARVQQRKGAGERRSALRVQAVQAPPEKAGASTGSAADDSGVYDVVVVGAGISGLTTAQVRRRFRCRTPAALHVAAVCAGALPGNKTACERARIPQPAPRPLPRPAGADHAAQRRGAAGAGDRGPRPRGRQHHLRVQQGGGAAVGGGAQLLPAKRLHPAGRGARVRPPAGSPPCSCLPTASVCEGAVAAVVGGTLAQQL